MDYGLKNKNVLITGSTKGLGKAIANVLAEEGANVIISGRSKAEAENLANKIAAQYNVQTVGIASDLLKKGAAETLFTESVERLEKLDILVNNAAIWPTSYVVDMEKQDFEKAIYMNLEVPYILSRMMVNHLLERKEKGKIVHIVSQAAFHGATTGHAHYASAKAGLVAFMISQAREVIRYGININAVAPGIMRTDMISQQLKEKETYYNSRIPIGRVAEPEEVAYAVAYLTSNKSDYLTGITIDATGGMLMR